MRIRSKTIFSNSSLRTTAETETKKISYWLEKLFRQGEKKEAEEEKISLQRETERQMQEEGLEDAVKEHSRKVGTDQHILEDMIAKSNRILISISSVFPWDFFPDTINVEETRVTIIQRQLFASQAHSVDIKTISNVFLDSDLFFASLTIVSRTFEENNVKIMKLRKKEAILTRRLIEGLRMFIEKDIDTSKYSTVELINKLKELSTTGIVL
ncbi:MAG: hypothetical protein COY68_02905 [Candidatus Levybacteria bacterium CG_4_10_14_0_8_um_filter_35_23]|nr:MAG: hypothetical protein COW87_04345 [Candidatus Levybacteria bacterium CG22_combo_CG10-13_8_21_14_all_35_11]PIY94484.1 MAG: hypothetical protein COY68_02905 [Candidatus Levybacteria bacterium CG_4_10_14_0_8_um_filter_35_23]PJC54611.1 MAG: hypothetical protein CO028_01605 [Candidatus Levybacteria bacterium CG_4_9_14_0_2_um_filter_35_21]